MNNNQHRDYRRPIIIVKKGQLNPKANVDMEAKPVAPRVLSDATQGWVKEFLERKHNERIAFNSLFADPEVQ